MAKDLLSFVVRYIDALIPAAIGCLFWLQGAGVIPFSRDREKNQFLTTTKGPGLRRTGMGLLAIGMVLGVAGVWRKPASLTPTQAAASLAARLGQYVPKAVDETTTLERVTSSGESLNLVFRMPKHTFDEIAESASSMQEAVRAPACSSELRTFISLGVVVKYSYYSSDSQLIVHFSLDEATCSAVDGKLSPQQTTIEGLGLT